MVYYTRADRDLSRDRKPRHNVSFLFGERRHPIQRIDVVCSIVFCWINRGLFFDSTCLRHRKDEEWQEGGGVMKSGVMKIRFNQKRRTSGGVWLIAFAVTFVVVVGAVTVYQLYKWKVRLDDIEKRREQQRLEESQIIIPPEVPNSITKVSDTHAWLYDENATLASPMEPDAEDVGTQSSPLFGSDTAPLARPLHPVILVGLSNDLLVLSITSDAGWTNTGLYVMDEFGLPDQRFTGPAPVRDVSFGLQRSSGGTTSWVTIVSGLGVSSNYPATYRDGDVTFGSTNVFYRAYRQSLID